jgi:hypothetical protein
VTRNLWHSCVRVPVAAHFAGRDPIVRATYRRFLHAARRYGPVTAYAQKSRIVFMTRVRFAGVTTRSRHLNAHLWLERPVEHPRLARVEHVGPHVWVHTFRLAHPDDVDAVLVRLMGEAYAVGRRD